MAKKEDLRVVKTHKALISAMLKLLQRRNFKQITVNDLCDEAFVSRAAFYAHFGDKYDLLSYWFGILKQDFTASIYKNADVVTVVYRFINENSKIIENLLTDSNDEVFEMVYHFMTSIVDIIAEANGNDKTSIQYIVLSNFCAGGMVRLLSWQIKNRFPPEMNEMTAHFLKILSHIVEWDAEST